MKSDQKRWDERYGRKGYTFGKEANLFLQRHISLLPRGKVLDIAAGEGRNAVFLAEHGFDVDAIDISETGLKKVRELAKEAGVKIHTLRGDLDTYKIGEGEYDLITNFYFLNRRLIPSIRKGIRKGGWVVFETYILEHRSLAAGGPTRLEYFLEPNELLRLFHRFRILRYREGIFRERGRKKAIASLIAKKI